MADPQLVNAWAAADAKHRAAGDRAITAMQKALPVGSEVCWDHGSYVIWGTVTWVSTWGYNHAHVGVVASRSGKEYSLHASRILSRLKRSANVG